VAKFEVTCYLDFYQKFGRGSNIGL